MMQATLHVLVIFSFLSCHPGVKDNSKQLKEAVYSLALKA